jgi:hypothetical protein
MAISNEAQRNHEALLPNHPAGNDRAVLVSTVTQLLPFIGYPRALSALRVINDGTRP